MGSGSSSHLQNLEISRKPVYETLEYDLYDAHDGYKKLSLFHFKINSDPDLIDFAAWKTIRHPLIIQYLDDGIVKGKKFVLTEYVEPVARVLSTLEPDEIICGLSDIFKALEFLHKRCSLSHNNVSPKSLFFSRKSPSNWKLGCTQLMSSPDEETFDFVKRMIVYKQLNSTHNFLPPEDLTPEICEPIPSLNEIHRRDSFTMGCMIEQLLPHFNKSELVRNLKSAKRDSRPTMGSVLLNEILFSDCKFLNFRESLQAFGSYSEEDKKSFVTTDAMKMMRDISPDVLASKVIPMLLTSRLVMLHPESRVTLHPHLFVPETMSHESVSSPLIPRSLFEMHVVPVIVRLFLVRKIKLRLILLQYLKFYARLVPDELTRSLLIPNIMLGLEDENDEILSATYASLSTIVQVCGGDILKGAVKQQRRKIFSNDVPRSSLSSSSHVVRQSVSNHNEPVADHMNCSYQKSDEWHGDWGSSPPSSPNSVINSGSKNGAVAIDILTGNNPTDNSKPITVSEAPIPNGSVVTSGNDQKSVESIKFNRKKRSGVHDLDIKAIEIQIPSEVEDLFSEMEPRVNFHVRADEEKNFRVNSHLADEVPRNDMFALRDVHAEEGNAGDWSNECEDWDEKQVNDALDRMPDSQSS